MVIFILQELRDVIFDTTINYSYNTLFGLGNLGPYKLDHWKVNNEIHQGTFDDIDELVSKMNDWDPNGNWVHEISSFSIEGGSCRQQL